MSQLRTWSCLAVAVLALVLPGASWAQQPPLDEQPPSETQEEAPASPEVGSDAPVRPPDPDALRTEPQAPLTSGGTTTQQGAGSTITPAAAAAPTPEETGVLLQGRPRQGPFLSGPGSLTFVLHHTLMGALGGFFTQTVDTDFKFDFSSREAVLAGTLIGAGLGFGASAWWQFNNWVDRPMAAFTIGNSVVGGMFGAGFMNMLGGEAESITWSAFVGAELAAWLTAYIGGGQLPLNDGLLVASGAGWGLAYTSLLLAIVNFSGTKLSGKTWLDALLLAPGIGAGAMALATMRYEPTAAQVLRADIFGGGVGAAVLLISGLLLGFDEPTPYVLSFLGSAGAIATVSLLWEESVDRSATLGANKKARPYKNVWW